MKKEIKGYTFTDDKALIDPKAVCDLLHTTYWAKTRPAKIIKKSLENSICISVFYGKKQVGIIRAISDQATYAAILDLVVHEDHRAKGLGKRLTELILNHPKIKNTKKILWTKDAEKLYEKYGFSENSEMKVLFQYP